MAIMGGYGDYGFTSLFMGFHCNNGLPLAIMGFQW